jgi:hypothetical protein
VSESAGGSATEQAGAQPGDLAGLPAEAARWVRHLGLEPLEHEGGLFRRMHLDEHSSAIYYLLADPDFSALHALDSVEVYHWYAGSPLRLLLLHPDGRAEERLLGPDPDAGQRPLVAHRHDHGPAVRMAGFRARRSRSAAAPPPRCGRAHRRAHPRSFRYFFGVGALR